MNQYLTCFNLLTPLHTGGSSQEGNLMGIAREVHTEFPYLPASSLRGKIRAELESLFTENGEADLFFGQKIRNGEQPTEGEVWFADASLIAFPIASLTHHLIWITCPLWLSRLNRWLTNRPLSETITQAYDSLASSKSALTTFEASEIYLQTAIIKSNQLEKINLPDDSQLANLFNLDTLLESLTKKLVIISDEDCISLVETGLQREVRVALNEGSKTTKDGSFRSEEAIPSEAVLFFPWGVKASKQPEKTNRVKTQLLESINSRMQFGGLESLGRGWADLNTIEISQN